MKLAFLELPGHERRLYFEQAAARRGLSAVVLEKDFWVCWLLGVLFRSEFRESLVFKGGTSLSKVFKVIERFSEDIDLSISPALLGLPEPGTSRNQADKWMTLAEAACAKAVQEQLKPTLEAEAKHVLGEPERGAWFEYAADPTSGSPNLLFHYPSHQPTGFDYLPRAVKLEFGSLTDQQPVGRHAITPWLLDALPNAIPDWQCDVVALGIDRTFWEKRSPRPSMRCSRHCQPWNTGSTSPTTFDDRPHRGDRFPHLRTQGGRTEAAENHTQELTP